jgi:large subunit ribosomal protein L18
MKLKTKDRKKFRVTNKAKKVSSADRFRLSISRSAKNISAQIIDDVKNITLLSSSSIEKDIKAMDKTNKTNISKIKSFRPPEPYKGKGIREQGQHILRKEGKKK